MRSRHAPGRRRLGMRLRRLGVGERLMAMALVAILAGGIGLIGQGLWLKATEAAPLPAAPYSFIAESPPAGGASSFP